MKTIYGKLLFRFASAAILAGVLLAGATQILAQRTRVRPPRVEGNTTIGTVNGQPITGNDLILMIDNNSPFMPPLEGEGAVSVLQQFEAKYPGDPTANPTPNPTTTPKPVAPSFSIQIQNMMKTGQEWLFKSLLDVIIKPMMPMLIFFAWIIGSFVLIVVFMRRFADNKGVDAEGLVRWAIRSIVFMVVIGASPFVIDALTVTGKFFARPVKSFNQSLVAEFDEKMKKYVKATFAVEDPNELLAEKLPNGEPGLVGIISDKESSVKDITGEMNILGWNMPRMFTVMVIGQNIIKFGGLFLAIAGLFILIGLKLAVPVLSAFGFDEKFANQIFYPFCWGVATFSLAFPIVKEVTLYVAYGIGLIELSIYNGETAFTLDPQTAQIIAELAPLEIRDFAYRKLIELAPACREKEINDGEKGLRARKILDFEHYGALPQTSATRRDLAREIRRLINQNFPDFVRQQKSGLNGLPGFWLDKNGKARLWLDKDYSCPMMLIPYRAANGLIQACQIRFMCRKLSKGAMRYVWLSTPETSGGLSCGSPWHFAFYNTHSYNKPILVTEGALKAETVRALKIEYDVLGCAGVTCSHEEIVTTARFRPLFIGFDADYHETIHVVRAFARLLGSLFADSAKLKIQPRVKILTWKPEHKGIDDALLQNIPIIPKSPIEWLKSLSEVSRREAVRVLPILNQEFITVFDECALN